MHLLLYCPIVCLKEMQKLPEAVHLIRKASMMYLENGTPDTAAMALGEPGEVSVDRGSAWESFCFDEKSVKTSFLLRV